MTTPSTEPSSPVPDKLMEDLHQANQKFHEARVELENQLDIAEPRRNERVETASQAVHAAERDVEAVTDQIGRTLNGERDQGPDDHTPPAN